MPGEMMWERMLGIRRCWATVMNREEWRKLLQEAKTLYEL
jgi:hypothetical protein